MNGCRPLNVSEIKAMLKHFKGRNAHRDRAWFLLGINTAFRISELLSVTLGDVLTEDGKIKDILAIKRKNTKGKKAGRAIIINNQAKAALVPCLETLRAGGIWHKKEHIFHSIRTGKVISRQRACQILRTVCKRSGVTYPGGTHCMRKTCADMTYTHNLNLLAKGYRVEPFRITSKVLGHMNINNTEKYLSFRTEQVDESIIAIGVGL